MFKEEIAKLLSKKAKLTKAEIIPLLETPNNHELGDYSFPCFILAKTFKKNPVNIAEDLASELKTKAPIELIKPVNGYLNFFIDKKVFVKETLSQINTKYGQSDIGKKKKIIIDFSSPNIGKPMHIGHIRSTIIGDSVLRIYNYLGYNALGINYMGDVGLHIGKLIVAYELWLDPIALKKDPVKELLRLYVKFNKEEESEVSEDQEDENEEIDYSTNEWTQKA